MQRTRMKPSRMQANDSLNNRVLRLGDKPLVLLGAGASVDAGIPETFDATREIVSRIGEATRDGKLAQALNFVCGALVA
jgi:hypothetical protein